MELTLADASLFRQEHSNNTKALFKSPLFIRSMNDSNYAYDVLVVMDTVRQRWQCI